MCGRRLPRRRRWDVPPKLPEPKAAPDAVVCWDLEDETVAGGIPRHAKLPEHRLKLLAAEIADGPVRNHVHHQQVVKAVINVPLCLLLILPRLVLLRPGLDGLDGHD